MKTTYYTATTLDGYLADEHDCLDWLFVQKQDEHGAFDYEEFIQGIGAIVMGATTYEWVLRHNLSTGDPWVYDMPAWVMTHRALEPVPGADIRFASGDVAPVHAAMAEAAGGKDLWVVGGGELACDVADAGLLDEIIVSIAPVTLGAGRPLFPRPFDLELREVARNGDFAAARYGVVGPRRGSA